MLEPEQKTTTLPAEEIDIEITTSQKNPLLEHESSSPSDEDVRRISESIAEEGELGKSSPSGEDDSNTAPDAAERTALDTDFIDEDVRADLVKMKRTTNSPYDTNTLWTSYNSDRVGAFKQTPERLNIDGRAFYLSLHLKSIDCRLNIGDIITKSDTRRAVFLGVRLANQDEEVETKTLLYFCHLPNNDINQDIICQNEDVSLRQLFMVKSSDMKAMFPFSLTDDSLPYEEPNHQCIVQVMQKVVVMIGEQNKELLLSLEQYARAESSDDKSLNPLNIFSNRTLKSKDCNALLSQKAKSIRVMTKAGTSKVSKILPPKVTSEQIRRKTANKRVVADAHQLITSTDDRILKSSKTRSGSHHTASSHHGYLNSESAFSNMTCAELLQLCNRFSIDIPPRSKKSNMVEALLNHGTTHHNPSPPLSKASDSGSAQLDMYTTPASSLKVIKADINNMFREEAEVIKTTILNDIHKSMKGNKQIQVEPLQEHDELIETKAQLKELLQQKQESKAIFQDHLDMFTKVSNIAKEPLMECIKLHSQQMVSLSSNLISQHNHQQNQFVVSHTVPQTNNGQEQSTAFLPPSYASHQYKVVSQQQHHQRQQLQTNTIPTNVQCASHYHQQPQFYGQPQQYSHMAYPPWHQQNMMALQSQLVHAMIPPSADQQQILMQQQFLSPTTQQPFTLPAPQLRHPFLQLQPQLQELHQPIQSGGLLLQQQQMTFPTCGMMSSSPSLVGSGVFASQQQGGPCSFIHPQQQQGEFPASA